MTQMSQTADAQDCRAKILRRYHTWVLLSGVCGKEWGVDLLANAVTRELLGCTVVKRNIKPFAVWTWYEIWAVWVAKIKWKAVSAQLGYVQETNLGYKARELSLSPEAAFHHIQITTHGCSLNSEPYRHHQQTKVAVRDWFWRRDAVLLTVKGNMQNSIQEIEISPFLRAAGPLANETHVLIIEDADMIFICATAVCVLHVDRVVINCRTMCGQSCCGNCKMVQATLSEAAMDACGDLGESGFFFVSCTFEACSEWTFFMSKSSRMSLCCFCTVKNPRIALTTEHRGRRLATIKDKCWER